ncbi:MAG TPA: hypothetical protein VHL34_11895 [Rhizomicrobium sp.]|jgi:hypothetical protein|nr:hypothetical protein [Rhizomicrobium sp.]
MLQVRMYDTDNKPVVFYQPATTDIALAQQQLSALYHIPYERYEIWSGTAKIAEGAHLCMHCRTN